MKKIKPFFTETERKAAMLELTGRVLQGFVTADSMKGRLPHEMLIDNLTMESVRFARRAVDKIEEIHQQS